MSIPLDVIGCADIFANAHFHGLARLSERFTLRSFTDTDPQKLSAFGRLYGVSRLYASTDEMLASTDGGAVLVATPTAQHASPAIAALSAGRDVLCEKPMAMTLAEADEMIAAARRNQRILQLCFMSRYAPCWMKIKELLDSGAIGTPISATMTQYWDSTPALYRNWRTAAAVSGGGIIADSAAHWIDILRWLLGEMVALTAAGVPAPDSPFPDVDDSSFVTFRFASGALGLLRNSWRHLRPDNEAETFELYGDKGTILGNLQTPWIDGGIQKVRLVHQDNTCEYAFNDPMKRFENQLAAFADTVEARTADTAADGRRALELQLAIYEAMRKRVWMDV